MTQNTGKSEIFSCVTSVWFSRRNRHYTLFTSSVILPRARTTLKGKIIIHHCMALASHTGAKKSPSQTLQYTDRSRLTFFFYFFTRRVSLSVQISLSLSLKAYFGAPHETTHVDNTFPFFLSTNTKRNPLYFFLLPTQKNFSSVTFSG